MRDLSEIKPFGENHGIFHLPPLKLIGKVHVAPQRGEKEGSKIYAARQEEGTNKFFDEFCDSPEFKTMLQLPSIIESVICVIGFEMTDDNYAYLMMCAVVPAETPVPDGLDWRRTPETLLAVGKNRECLNEIKERIEHEGYLPNTDTPGCCWCGFFNFYDDSGEPELIKYEMYEFIPCREKGIPE